MQANLLESLAYICINYTDSVFSPTLHHTAAGCLAHGDHPCVVECELHRAAAVIIMRISERRRSKNVIYMLNAAAGAYGWRCQWHDAESELSVVYCTDRPPLHPFLVHGQFFLYKSFIHQKLVAHTKNKLK